MSVFNEGLMTGANMGRGIYRAEGDRQVGGLMAKGDYKGASAAAYGFGDLSGGMGIDRFGQAQGDRERGANITGALRTGDTGAAMGFASSPDEIEMIREWGQNATEQERARVSQEAGEMVALIESVTALPPDQQLAAMQANAPQFGVEPAQITPDVLQRLPGLRVQALGVRDYLKYQQDERDATRPIVGPNGVILLPPGAPAPNAGGQPEYVDQLPPGVRPVNPNQPASGQPAQATSEMSQSSRVSFRSTEDAASSIRQIVPGVRLTSGTRSQADNQRVGGVTTSNHLRGRAWDLVPPGGMSMAQLAQKMRSEGFRAIDEGDHVHVSW